jgi:pyruvate dehydrogenase E2 component (dihydrolipoamide acetyltransferase)
MVHTFSLPDLGEGIGEAEVVNWLVGEGETVEEDQPIVEVETDKAVVDVPSPVDGTVQELLVSAGDTVAVGADIVTFATEGEGDAETGEGDAPDDEAATPEPAITEAGSRDQYVAAPRIRRLARELGVDIEAISPGGDRRITERDVVEAAGGTAESTTVLSSPSSAEDVLATPHARTVADELSVDLTDVPPGGTHGGEDYVSTEDVEAFAESQGDQVSAPESAEREDREPYRGIRRTIGEQMERSRFTAPHATTLDEVTIDDLVDVRDKLAGVADEQDVSLTYTPFLVKAVTAALKDYPYLNSSLDEDAEEIVKKRYYNVGVAIGASSGLVVPVIEDADRKSLLEIAREIQDFAERAETGDIEPREMRNGTFTVTNIGMVGGEYGTPVINYPEVAILSVGTVSKKPRVVDDDIVPRHVMPLSLSIDHRVVDGITAVRFLNAIEEQLQEPERILLE